MKKLLFFTALTILIIGCDSNNDDDFTRVSDDETSGDIDFIEFLQVQNDQVFFDFLPNQQTGEEELALVGRFITDTDVTVTVDDLDVDLEFQPVEENPDGDEIFLAAHSLDQVPLEPGDEVEYEVQIEDVIYEGSIDLTGNIDASFPDTLLPDEPFEMSWETEEDPDRFFNLLFSQTEDDDLALLWEIPGDARESEFDLSDFEDVSEPEKLIQPELEIWSVNFDNFVEDDLIVASVNTDGNIYDYDEDDYDVESLLIDGMKIQERKPAEISIDEEVRIW